MARKWTSERNERFLLLIVENVKVDYKKLAAKYAEKYGKLRMHTILHLE